MKANDAHSFLRDKRSYTYGIVCECCINTCRLSEIRQYCSSSRRKRSTATNSYDFAELEKLYRSPDLFSPRTNNSSDMTLTQYRKMQIIEATKRRNIANKLKNILINVGETTTKLPLSDITKTPPRRSSNLSLGEIIASSLDEPSHRHRHGS